MKQKYFREPDMRTIIACAVLMMALVATPLSAGPLDDAREIGQVIETPDGYIKANGKVPADIHALVQDINKRRRQAYAKIAKKNGIAINQVAQESYRQRKKKYSPRCTRSGPARSPGTGRAPRPP